MRDLIGVTWYLLYDGTSVDGRGDPKYIGRTLSEEDAIAHNNRCKTNPYSTGKVVIVTETGLRTM